MEGLKQVSSTVEYIYETEEIREEHIKLMEQEGWKNFSGSQERTRESEGHDWYTCFTRKY